jgi:hypothetical protein
MQTIYGEIDWTEPKGEHGVNWTFGEHGVNWTFGEHGVNW